VTGPITSGLMNPQQDRSGQVRAVPPADPVPVRASDQHPDPTLGNPGQVEPRTAPNDRRWVTPGVGVPADAGHPLDAAPTWPARPQPPSQPPGQPPDRALSQPPGRAPSRPVRWLIAVAEVAAAVALAVLAVWAWRRATIPVELPDFDNPAIPHTVSRMSGPWAGAAVAAAAVAGMLLVDAVRHAVLARRAGAPDRTAPPPREDRED
jgi:hypothetical protein